MGAIRVSSAMDLSRLSTASVMGAQLDRIFGLLIFVMRPYSVLAKVSTVVELVTATRTFPLSSMQHLPRPIKRPLIRQVLLLDIVLPTLLIGLLFRTTVLSARSRTTNMSA